MKTSRKGQLLPNNQAQRFSPPPRIGKTIETTRKRSLATSKSLSNTLVIRINSKKSGIIVSHSLCPTLKTAWMISHLFLGRDYLIFRSMSPQLKFMKLLIALITRLKLTSLARSSIKPYNAHRMLDLSICNKSLLTRSSNTRKLCTSTMANSTKSLNQAICQVLICLCNKAGGTSVSTSLKNRAKNTSISISWCSPETTYNKGNSRKQLESSLNTIPLLFNSSSLFIRRSVWKCSQLLTRSNSKS